MNQGALHFEALLTTKDFERGMERIRNDICRASGLAVQETSKMDSAFKNLSIGIAGYFSGQALMGFARELINVRGEFQKTEIAFATMLKSKEKANQLMGQMVDLAAKTPFSLQEVSAGAKQLLAFQVPANEVVDTLTRMGNIAAGLGVPMSRINLVYGQVMAKGKLMGDDLRQFTEAGIPMVGELAKKFGKTTAEISTMVSEGRIGFNDVKEVLFSLTNEGGLFFNLMEEQSKTLSGKVANLEDAFDQMLNKIGEGSEGLLNSGIEGATYLVEHYEDVIDVLTILVATYGSYRAALIVTSVLQKAQIAQQAISNWLSLAKSIRTAKDAQALFNLTTSANPIGAIIALIGLLATTYVTYGDEIKKIIGITNEYDEINKELSKTLSEIDQKGTEEISTLGKLYKVATDDKKSREERLAATKRLQNEYPSYFGNLSAEIIMAGKAANAYNSLREAIIASAKARAIRSKIEEIEKERLEGEAELINKKEEILKKYRKGKKEGWKDETVNYGRDEFGNSNIVTFRGEDNKKALASQFVGSIKEIVEYRKETGNLVKVYADMAEEQEKKAAQYNADRKNKEEKEQARQSSNLEQAKKKAKAHQKALAEVYSKNSIKDLEERISLWNNALERATKDKDGNYQVKVRAKDKYGKEYETGQVVSKDKALEELKVLNETKAKIEEEFRIKSTEEELAELKRRINLRDKYLQLGMNRPELINEDTVNNLFPDLKDKSYVQVLEEKRKAYLGLIEAQKATEQTTIDLIFIENELKNAKGTETFMQGVNDRVSELKERYKGAELIDKLKKDKSLQLGGTEEENLERNKAYASALKEAQKDYDKFYRDLLEQQKTYEEKSLELQNEYAALKATERYKNASEEEQKKIDKHYKKEQSKLDMDAFKESGDWALAFSDLEYMSQSTIERVIKNFEDFKRAKEQNLEPTELRELNDTLNKLRARAGNNPFTGIISGVKGYVQANKDAKTAQDEYNATVEKFGKNSPQAQEAYRKMTDAEQEAIKAKQLLNAQLQKGQDIFNATIQGVTELADAFGGMDDATKDAIEDITAVGNAAFDLAKSISSGNIAGMITAGVKLIGSIIKALNGDKKRERNIKRWAQALEEVKEQYRALEHQISKTLGENVYKEQGKIIANLRQQQQMLQRMANEEAGKKKSDSGKIAEYRNQANEIDRQITDIIDKMKNDIAQTDAKSLADKMGDALFEAWQRGEDGAKAYEKTVDDVMRNAAKAALKQKLLEGPMQEMIDNLVKKMGFGGGDASIEAEIKKKESRLEEIQNEIKNGNIVQKTISAVKAMALKAQIEKLKKQYEDSKNINPNGSFDGLTPEEREEIKNQGKVAMNNYMEALKQYQDLFGAAEENADSLKGGIKGMSEETAGILAGQFNAIRIHVAEIQKNQGFGLDIAKSSLMNLTKIEENTRNLYQMRKDLSEMNAKIKSNDTRGLGL
nr:tape measure protein [Riemerella anatipestifer]